MNILILFQNNRLGHTCSFLLQLRQLNHRTFTVADTITTKAAKVNPYIDTYVAYKDASEQVLLEKLRSNSNAKGLTDMAVYPA